MEREPEKVVRGPEDGEERQTQKVNQFDLKEHVQDDIHKFVHYGYDFS